MKQWEAKKCMHNVQINVENSKKDKAFICPQCEQMAIDAGHADEVAAGQVFIYTDTKLTKKPK